MEQLNVSIKNQVYTVEHPINTINLYRIKYAGGAVEVTRNRNNGKWKVLSRSKAEMKLPIQPIGKAIEKCLNIVG
ncbi:hypothetical protein ACSBL2_05650 [Pedobacter sp. AW31-3R]|uniref:hypothetical protein n=1 Tax=Pedobacter sp. AW31-3R TaxID=3445781 RepID=UPI003FA09A14